MTGSRTFPRSKVAPDLPRQRVVVSSQHPRDVGYRENARPEDSIQLSQSTAKEIVDLLRRGEKYRREGEIRAAVLGFTIGLVVSLCVSTCSVRAQHEPDFLLLARSCVSERGWRTDTDDCAAIAEVVRDRMDRRDESFSSSIRALAPRLHGGTITDRLWLLDLDEDAHRPAGLGVSWTRPRGELPSRREAWLATLDEARSILAGTRPSPCVERPRHWGSRADVARRRARGFRWVSVDCGNVVNLYGHLFAPVGGGSR